MPRGDRIGNRGKDLAGVWFDDFRDDAAFLRGKFRKHGNVKIPIKREGQGTGNRGRGHQKDVCPIPFFAEQSALVDAEFMLLVDDDETEIRVRHPLGKEGVGSDSDIDAPVLQALQNRLAVRGSHGPDEKADFHRRRGV